MLRSVGETGSTNADMLALAAAGEPEGLWLRADRQSAGRGRMGRDWQSPTGNFYGSTLVRLLPGDPEAATLALVAAVAVHDVLSAFAAQVPFRIKWPNDVMVEGAKISGILLERTGDSVVVGIGVNLAFHPEGLPRAVTSLAGQGAPVPAPDVFQVELADAFARWLRRWRSEGLAVLRAAWVERAHPAGTALSVNAPDGSVTEGLFDGLEADGALRLRLADGSVRAIHAGDIFLI